MSLKSEEKISNNVDFSLWSNHAKTQTHIWNWNFFHTHCDLWKHHKIHIYISKSIHFFTLSWWFFKLACFFTLVLCLKIIFISIASSIFKWFAKSSFFIVIPPLHRTTTISCFGLLFTKFCKIFRLNSPASIVVHYVFNGWLIR